MNLLCGERSEPKVDFSQSKHYRGVRSMPRKPGAKFQQDRSSRSIVMAKKPLCLFLPIYIYIYICSGGFRGGGQGGPGGGEMVSAQYLRGARRGGGNLLAGRPKILGEGEMKTYIRHCIYVCVSSCGQMKRRARALKIWK